MCIRDRVYTQRVRTLDDALESAQINCVDGSVLLASLMKAININPILEMCIRDRFNAPL